MYMRVCANVCIRYMLTLKGKRSAVFEATNTCANGTTQNIHSRETCFKTGTRNPVQGKPLRHEQPRRQGRQDSCLEQELHLGLVFVAGRTRSRGSGLGPECKRSARGRASAGVPREGRLGLRDACVLWDTNVQYYVSLFLSFVDGSGMVSARR